MSFSFHKYDYRFSSFQHFVKSYFSNVLLDSKITIIVSSILEVVNG